MPNDVLFVGHSLVGHTMPRMLDALLTTAQVREQVINGSPLAYNWDHCDTAEGVNARAALASCAYGTLILTEAIPLAGHIEWSNTYGIARAYGQTAWAANPATRVMIYETWHEMGADTALWRDNLTTDLALWQGIAAHVNAQKPGAAPTVGIVPGGQAMGLLYDSIAAGRGLGLTDIRQLFTDTIHPNDAGNYLISLVQYAAITGRSAVGLTGSLMGEWGQPYTGWTAEQTVLFQHIAWEAAARAPGARLASGTALPQLLLGTAGNDALTGGTGDDRLYGANGNDVLTGGKGHDLMAGERGNDRLTGAAGNDFLLGGQGIPALLKEFGLGSPRLINTPFAVMVGTVYGYLPLMVFPIYVSLEKLDKRLLEAAADLGAPPLRRLWQIAVPISMPGVATGSMLVFILLMGEFLIPAMLGGGKVFFVGNALVDLFLQSRNWPFGSALAMTLVAIMLVIIGVYLKLVARFGGRPADGGI